MVKSVYGFNMRILGVSRVSKANIWLLRDVESLCYNARFGPTLTLLWLKCEMHYTETKSRPRPRPRDRRVSFRVSRLVSIFVSCLISYLSHSLFLGFCRFPAQCWLSVQQLSFSDQIPQFYPCSSRFKCYCFITFPWQYRLVIKIVCFLVCFDPVVYFLARLKVSKTLRDPFCRKHRRHRPVKN